MTNKESKYFFLSKEEKKITDVFILSTQIAMFEKILNSSKSISEESERLGVDIVDMVNKNFKKLLLKL